MDNRDNKYLEKLDDRFVNKNFENPSKLKNKCLYYFKGKLTLY